MSISLRFITKSLSNLLPRCVAAAVPQQTRGAAHYPVNDKFYGLNEEQQKLREIAFNFYQKELAPYAKEIDKNDNFKWALFYYKKKVNIVFTQVEMYFDPSHTEIFAHFGRRWVTWAF